MRGYPAPHYRAGTKLRPADEATARPYSLPAPYEGWNARGNLANMSPLEAIVLDNIFPGVQDVSVRKGSVDHSTGYVNDLVMLIPYSGASDKLFAATDAGIYDATAGGAVGAAVAACTEGFWSFVNFANSGGRWLSLCNGVDPYKTYDGTTWATPAIVGVAGTSLNYVTLHQKRLWFVEKNTMNLWYLAADAISGAATLFPVGNLFKRGGYVVAIGSWTIDGGSGTNDYFVICTSNGELAVYQGTDPASSATWALIGVFAVAQPCGSRPFVDYGGDLLYFSRVGIIPMTKIIQSSILDLSETISFKIDGAFLDAVENNPSDLTGWHMITHRSANMLIVNIPATSSESDPSAAQYVMNTITKAWCRFTGWNARTWAALGSNIYYAGARKVVKAWTGNADNSASIIGRAAQAYNYLGNRGQKEVSLVRPNVAFSNAVALQMALDADFNSFSGSTIITYVPVSAGAIWDSSLWDTGIWDIGNQVLDPKWTTVPGNLGYLHSFRIQFTSAVSEITWTSTDFATRPAGIL